MNRKLRTHLKSIKKTDLIWRYVSNLSPTLTYNIGRTNALTDVEKELVGQIDRDGVASTDVESVVRNRSELDELYKGVDALLIEKRDEIETLKSNANLGGNIGNKTFNLESLGSELIFDSADVFARFALNNSFLNIANAYFRMKAKLRYYNVWYTAATHSDARESQLWHFDREDNYILKVFLYLDDVDEGAGPFTYAPKTHRKGQMRSLQPDFFLEGGVRRTTDEQMAAVYPKADWRICTGKKGTIVFADTRGYHKGGEARTKDRLMFTCMFTSPASESRQLIKIPPHFDSGTMTDEQLEALVIQ